MAEYVANDFDYIAKSLAKLKEEKQAELARDPDKVEVIANTVVSNASEDAWYF